MQIELPHELLTIGHVSIEGQEFRLVDRLTPVVLKGVVDKFASGIGACNRFLGRLKSLAHGG
jgi:hypothetical protein